MSDLATLRSRLNRLSSSPEVILRNNARLIDPIDRSYVAAIQQEVAETILPRCLIFCNDRSEELQIDVQNGEIISERMDEAIAQLADGAKWMAVKSYEELEKTGWVASFLKRFSGAGFDAVHVVDDVPFGTYGTADDFVSLALRLSADGSEKATAFACSASHDIDHILFCGAASGEVLIFRTRQVRLEHILQTWQDVKPKTSCR